ncbi:hypothetical protein MSUIS_04890 [Mycoplasma suis KI3806]|uniref:Uncharacterized protein n=1 Tax=Mycoplasma suis (strain KI_3806) TaxID=708248 RepID=F0V1Q1_MYCS3|nr:hypothetical protein [Mycoplasma suis]CBZ40582.1 hypothetical protein MSUIS_04890 [Mycoplasma suis KI3806]
MTETGQAKEIKPSLHGQKQRFMWDGTSIDKLNSWFGSRSVPFSNGESKELQKTLGDVKLLDYWEKLKKGFLSQNSNELSNLSDWFDKLSDEDKCGVIDVFMECSEFRNAIRIGEKSPIKNGFKIDLSKLIELEKTELPKFTDLFSKKGVFFIGGFMNMEDKVGKTLNGWITEELKKENFSSTEKISKSSQDQKINGMHLIKTIALAEKYSDGCEVYSKNEDEKEIFSECLIEKSEILDEDPYNKGEVFLNPKVLDVIKAGTMDNFKGSREKKPAFVVEKSKQDLSSDKKEWKEFSENKKSEVSSSFHKNGQWKGVLDVSCSYISESGWWSVFSMISGISPEKLGWWEFYTLFFRSFGANEAPERRLCLFEIPKVKSYLKETNLFGPFMVTNWINGNKLWMKCSIHSL